MPKNFDPFDSVKIGKGLKSAAGSIVNKVRNSIAKSNQERKFNELNPPTYQMKQEQQQKFDDAVISASTPMGVGGTIVGKSAVGFNKIARHWSDLLDMGERAEISDVGMKLKKNIKWKQTYDPEYGNSKVAKLKDLIIHRNLFKAYPELKDYEVLLAKDPFSGKADAFNKTVLLGSRNRGLNTVVHEISHLIGAKEGFSLGANNGVEKTKIVNKIKAKLLESSTLEKLQQMHSGLKLGSKKIENYLRQKIITESDKIRENIKNRTEEINTKANFAHDRNLGEAYANATESRMNMNKKQLDATDPLARNYTGVDKQALTLEGIGHNIPDSTKEMQRTYRKLKQKRTK